MTPRMFEDYLRQLIDENGRKTRADATVSVRLDGEGVVVTVGLDQGPKTFRVRGSSVEPATFDSPSQGGAS